MSKYEVGTHRSSFSFSCYECAVNCYNELSGKKYIKDVWKNRIILNTYGWKQ